VAGRSGSTPTPSVPPGKASCRTGFSHGVGIDEDEITFLAPCAEAYVFWCRSQRLGVTRPALWRWPGST
jgi:hypothetical protein